MFCKETDLTRFCALVTLFAVSAPLCTGAQSKFATLASVPGQMAFSGAVKDTNGQALTGLVGVRFSVYKDQQGGTPLWAETQNVQLGEGGR